MLLIDSYIDINRCHSELSMDVLVKEKNTWLCIYFILHNDAWKHRMNNAII